MKSLTTTLLLFFLLINIVFVTCAPRICCCLKGLSYKSKEKNREKEIDNEEKIVMRVKDIMKKKDIVEDTDDEEEEVVKDTDDEEGEEEDIDLKYCKMELFVAFKKETPMENFLHALLNINEDNFWGKEAYTEKTKGYYQDLLYTVLDMNIPTLMNPKQFCYSDYGSNASSSTSVQNPVVDCLRVIADAGCEASVEGIICMEKLYLRWKKKNFMTRPVSGTGNFTDGELFEAISRVSDNTHNISDEDLYKDYVNEHGACSFTNDELFEEFRVWDTNNYYRECHESEQCYCDDDFREYIEFRQRECDLFQARRERYGIGEVSYADIVKEYKRRQNLRRQYDTFYAMYIHDKIKDCDGSKLKSRKEYCKEYLKDHPDSS